jgi:Icc-related predicted phosphoesterase
MRILVIADVHGSNSVRKNVQSWVAEHTPNIIVVAGDITQFGPPEWAEDFLNSIPLKTLAIPGNLDPKSVLEAIESSQAIPLHGKKVDVEGYNFVGLGGSNATPFGTPFELSEEEIYEILNEVMVEKAVLVSHAPVQGHLDSTASVEKTGSQALTWIISEFSPIIVISGHIHEARGVEQEGGITYINPGPASQGYGAIIDLEGDEVKVELIRA